MAAPVSVETLHLSVRELSGRIRKREISPVSLTNAYLERLESVGPALGAVVTVTRDLALAEAKAAEAEIAAGKWRGPLHGIPYGVKDLLATKGIPTTWGAEPFRTQVFDHDATVVRKLREAGAVLVAKLAMVELAGAFGYNNPDASFTGPGRSPWNVKFWSGGSSAGPGAATAAGLVGFSIGSETSGSIITPAAYSGVSGLRPTYGRVSRHGAMALCWTLDKLGPMCRTAEDCGLVMAAIAGADPLDPTTVDRPWKPRPGARRFRIGVLKGSAEKAQPAVRRNFEESVTVLRSFCDVTDDVPFPDLPFGPAVSTIVAAEGASAFRDLIESGETQKLRAANDKWGGFSASMVLAVDYLQAMRLRAPARKALDELCRTYDALAAPSRQTVASPIGVDFDKAYPGVGGGPAVIPAGNLAGQPAISVVNGFGENGLPTGIQFQGRAFADETLVAIAAEYQRRTDWHTKRPPV
ncbi:MAG TPA: amidase [Thermoanaerobaculia bacterium]|nr:amidase [Thermoanaerobaculia bacterium]HQR66711.1 amidase [Thermoanaerobaculia bacterium]